MNYVIIIIKQQLLYRVTDPTINPGQTQGDVALSVGAAMGVMIAVVLSVSTAVIIAVIFLKRKKTRR